MFQQVAQRDRDLVYEIDHRSVVEKLAQGLEQAEDQISKLLLSLAYRRRREPEQRLGGRHNVEGEIGHDAYNLFEELGLE